MCLTGRCSMCQREEKTTMIDWDKPLECTAFTGHTVYFIGFTPDKKYAVIQACSGTLYKADKHTGTLLGGTSTVRNKKEPWEKAWEKHKEECNSVYYRPEDYFKKVFNLGLEWQETQNKKC